jgi:hypothetical protein
MNHSELPKVIIKEFKLILVCDKEQLIPEEALFQVIMNGLSNGHPFNLGIKGLTVQATQSAEETK